MSNMNDLIREIYGPVVEKQYGLTIDQITDYLNWSGGHTPPIEFMEQLVEGCGPFHFECGDNEGMSFPIPPNK